MKYLDLAAELASEVDWRDVYPNPRVGCVIVQNGEVVSRGVHEKCGGAHAEVVALENLKTSNYKLQTSNNEDLGQGEFKSGLEVYVTLEPCDYFPGKKTGSCTQKLLKLNPEKIVIGSLDERFCGKNVQKLKEAGIEVEVMNHELSSNLSRVKPHVILKLAQTLDGKIGKTSNFNLQTTNVRETVRNPVYISSLSSRKKVHEWRSEVDALLTTTGTVIADDPTLDCRLLNKEYVPRLCVFGKKEISRESRIFQFSDRQVDFFSGEDLVRDLREMSEMGIKTVLTECGAAMATSLLQAGLVDEIRLFVAPRIFGQGVDVFPGEIDVSEFEIQKTEKIGGDILITFVR